jgi:hypothetical protein
LVTSGIGVPSISTAIPAGVTSTTQSAANSSTLIATTAFVNQGGLTLGTSTATTQAAADSSTKVATTAFVNSTALTLHTGTTAVTQSPLDDSTKVATTAYTDAAVAAISLPVTTYQVTDSTDITLSAAPTQANIGSTFSMTIPTHGYITFNFTGELISSGGSSYLIIGIRIGSTNYFPQVTSGSATYF